MEEVVEAPVCMIRVTLAETKALLTEIYQVLERDSAGFVVTAPEASSIVLVTVIEAPQLIEKKYAKAVYI